MAAKVSPAGLYDAFEKAGIGYYAGVPDSLLAPFISYLSEVSVEHEVAINEGHAVALAIGYHVATGKVPAVYMQNSGLGNATNPLLSLADPAVMNIPMVLLIGWRGRPGVTDEPQHKKQGEMTLRLLEAIGVPTTVLGGNAEEIQEQIRHAVECAKSEARPVAVVVPEDLLGVNNTLTAHASADILTREDAIKTIADEIPPAAAVVATTGKTGRELFEYREAKGRSHDGDLLIVGGMGHASAIAQSVAKHTNDRDVYVLDGDGAALMHMGALAHNGTHGGLNFYHLLINNGTHESVGGQPTIARSVDLPAIAKASGYAWAIRVRTKNELTAALAHAKGVDGPSLIEIMTTSGSRSGLTRPTISPADNKSAFMRFLKES